jgi:hypothetical protein
VPAVVWGGVGTLAVVTAWAVLFPRLRRVDSLAAQPQPVVESPSNTNPL